MRKEKKKHSVPNDVLFVIFSFLPYHNLVNVSTVAKDWNLISNSDVLWLSHQKKRFGIPKVKENYKKNYIEEFFMEKNWKKGKCQTEDVKLEKTQRFNFVQFINNGEYCVNGTMGGTIQVIELKTSKIVKNFVGHKSQVYCLVYGVMENQNYMISSSQDGTVRVWDIEKEKQVNVFEGLGPLMVIQICEKRKLIFAGGKNQIIYVLSYESGKKLYELNSHTATITGISFNGEHLFSGSLDKSLIKWDIDNGQVLKKVKNAHSGYITCIKATDRLLTGGADKMITLWDINTLNEIQTYEGHTQMIKDALIHKINDNYELMVSCSRDKTVKLWNLKSGDVIATLMSHTDEINYLHCEKDKMISVSDTKMKLYNFSGNPHLMKSISNIQHQNNFSKDKKKKKK